jgi:transportin-3
MTLSINNMIDAASNDPVFISCVQSWTKEISLSQIAGSPILVTIFKALDSSDAFDAAIECIITMVRETSDVDDSIEDIKILSPMILNLRSKLAEAAEEEDSEVFKGLGRLFSECGEKWVVLISREPRIFRPLVETILQVCILDWEKEAIGYTFQFWEDLKLWLVLDKYEDARQVYSPFLSRLVDIMIEHLKFPDGEGTNDKDLFDGNREQEERFRNYRHEMGNVLKDCCEVLGVSECLSKTYALIEAWVGKYGNQATSANIPHWQELEAPIFALRALGQTVPPDENVMLPRLIPLLVQIPDHEKIRYQAVMTLGRYTEWTARHPDTLEMQLQFIMAAFDHPSKEVVRGATHAFQYFCNDCAELLKGFFGQIHSFFVNVIDRLPDQAQNDVSEGMAAILAKQPIDELYQKFKLCCDPILQSIVQMGQNANDDKVKFMIAGKYSNLQVISLTPSRQDSTHHHIHPKGSAPCRTSKPKSCGSVLSRDQPDSQRAGIKLSKLHSNFGKGVSVLEIYGAFIPSISSSYSAGPSLKTGRWIPSYTTRMLPLGY